MRVKVYRNLHKDCFSVASLEGENYGKVISHEKALVLRFEKATVQPKGRARVLKEKTKNVHAWLIGKTNDDTLKYAIINKNKGANLHINPHVWDKVSYDPYTQDEFTVTTDGKVESLNGKKGILYFKYPDVYFLEDL